MNTAIRTLGAVALLGVVPGAIVAQQAVPQTTQESSQQVYHACYVPGSGTVYRIKEPGLPDECGKSGQKQHVEFGWTDGAGGGAGIPGPEGPQGPQGEKGDKGDPGGGGVSVHGQLGGLDADDHTQYLLTSGVRVSKGFAVTSSGPSSVPVEGAGTRLMWHPGKQAFRAGRVFVDRWNEDHIGIASVALGLDPLASGAYSFATSQGQATGQHSVAMGGGSEASGVGAIALGSQAFASGDHSLALTRGKATGTRSIAAGFDSEANATSAIALGTRALAVGINSFAASEARARGLGATAFWQGEAVGDHTFAWRGSALDVGALALGSGAKASGNRSVAIGVNSTASGPISTALGTGVTASGIESLALGKNSTAAAEVSVAIGFSNSATGLGSLALGRLSKASGETSTAMGRQTTASGLNSTAMGQQTTASGQASTAMGYQTTASGLMAVAMGSGVEASGSHSIAMGTRASTASRTGSFVYGDLSSQSSVKNTRDNQFAVRAQWFWFGKSGDAYNDPNHFIATSTGARLTHGGVWENGSDVNRKHLFAPVDREAVLRKAVKLPVTTWAYKNEDSSVRHMGPMAQDFRAAFGLGTVETSIGTVDMDGVLLVSVQALEARTTGLRNENKALRDEIETLRREHHQMVERLDRLEAAIAGQAPKQ